MVLAAVSGRRLAVTALGRSIQSEAKERHCIKRADRLLSNKHLHAEGVGLYRGAGGLILGGAIRPLIIVDWSDLDGSKRHFLLRASTPAGGRALTLYEEVHTLNTQGETKDPSRLSDAFASPVARRMPADYCDRRGVSYSLV